MSGLRLVSKTVPKITGQIFEKKYTLLGRIVTQWEEIIGAELAMKAQPVKMIYRKTPDKKKQFTLEIAANSAEAALLQYRTDLILERLNLLLGERMITAIRFVPFTANKAQPAPRRRAKKPASPEDQNYLAKTLENVSDPDIQEKLKNMGRSFLEDKARNKDD